MADFYIGQGDTASTLLVTLRDANGNAVNITGASVHIDVTPIHGGAKIVDAAATIVDAPTGQVSYTFTAPQTATAGDFLATFTVTFGGGAIESFPNAGYYLITIQADAPTTAQNYLSVEELKKTLNLTNQTYADQDIKRAIGAASRAIENYCRRKFIQGSPGEVRKFYPVSPDYVTIDDITTVTSIVGGDGATLVLDTDYRLDSPWVAKPGPPYDTIRSVSPPNLYSILGYGFLVKTPLTITGTWGWPAIPDPITEYAGILASRLLQRARSSPNGILVFGDSGEASRITRNDPDAETLLGPYTRSTMIE